MKKGLLIETVLADNSINWDRIFQSLALRGRHKEKKRWRRAVIVDTMRRPFLRGGARRRGDSCNLPRVRAPPPAPVSYRLLKVAPWFVDVRELQAFEPQEVWDQFCICFPVLAIYRKGWASVRDVANVPSHMEPALWSGIWGAWRTHVSNIGEALNWPPCVMEICGLLVPLSRKLYPEEPWEEWFPDGADTETVPRAIVPYLRRSACLCHGFHQGGCSPRGVWEAITLPTRLLKIPGP